MRKYASPRFEKTLALARNLVNITFPAEFGTPLILQHPEGGVAAMFPDHVQMRSRLNDRPVMLHPIGEGSDAASAIIDLFETYARSGDYEDILVTSRGGDLVFGARETPYDTVMFQRLHVSPVTAVGH